MRVGGVYQLVAFYNLDVIISVGYRVKSKNGIIFRRWANKVLKDYLLKGYAINQRRLDYLEKTVKLIDIATRVDTSLENSDAKEVLKVISSYSKALDLLDDYDHKSLSKIKGSNSNIFALERDYGSKSIIGYIYQTFDKIDVYKNNKEVIDNNTLTALTLLIAQSNPKEKDLIIDLIMNFLE